MANNRLYLVNRDEQTYTILAKSFGWAWYPSLRSLKIFLENTYEGDKLEIIKESDDGIKEVYKYKGVFKEMSFLQKIFHRYRR